MIFKKGAIEIQFNWLFVLIVGAVILIIFSGIIIKQKNISVEKQYDYSIPKITASGNELNQVWTNLIHNAIDAVDNQGIIQSHKGV